MLDAENSSEISSNSEISFEELEFRNYCEANEFDYDEAAMDADTRGDFVKIKKRFLKAIAEKRIVVDGDKIVYTVSEKSSEMAGQKLTIHRPNGRTLLAMDGYKDIQQQNKLQAYMAALCRIPRNEINKISSLDKKDYQIIQDAAVLFLTE
ncbi:MAG: hypothetical protein FWC64_07135 [Treponema sp.]|nr:hypothetical protein [Treponema sp.]